MTPLWRTERLGADREEGVREAPLAVAPAVVDAAELTVVREECDEGAVAVERQAAAEVARRDLEGADDAPATPELKGADCRPARREAVHGEDERPVWRDRDPRDVERALDLARKGALDRLRREELPADRKS